MSRTPGGSAGGRIGGAPLKHSLLEPIALPIFCPLFRVFPRLESFYLRLVLRYELWRAKRFVRRRWDGMP